ncbi:recombinase family protein [Persicimonas caeni]|uniref:Recombinase family protein n=1 Tax=Persicimonas caeni TaxID=2292766 RepID=A0A4Y6PYT0_PERCE|nr:recombinase family protein [Persicimonas caeni]QDG53157.1 recombinase family protein [Persicimonas caeni]QED34379.1 recombinase family protein [Persicimonas caeni]
MTESAILRPPKITERHVNQLVVVYVRQSTLQQLEEHQESTRRQYALAKRARRWGWSDDQILTIDDDLGTSGASIQGRQGLQKLMQEVRCGHVGLILALELSRYARCCLDWYRLLELCAQYDTLIAENDVVYEPCDPNDRMLLGVKATMSETELHIMKQRLEDGKLAKAKRGELVFDVPRGYVWSVDEEIIKDPDAQVRRVIELIFEVFERRRTIGGVCRYLEAHDIKLPHRRDSFGHLAHLGPLEWHKATNSAVSNLLRHPIYAGAYVYGRRQRPSNAGFGSRGEPGRVRVDQGQWLVLLKANHPAYIDWKTYERNVEQLEDNKPAVKGYAQNGQALLGGLVLCGGCGWRMSLHYKDPQTWRYECENYKTKAKDGCRSFSGMSLDELIETLVLQALEPAAIEMSLRVIEEAEKEREKLRELWEQKLERARYRAQRAFEQYDAVDPRNRLVAQTLEDRWQEALEEEERIRRDYARQKAEWQTPLPGEQAEEIRRLAQDLPVLWHAEETLPKERQEIVRAIVDEIHAQVEGETERLRVEVHWAGGDRTAAIVQRPVQSWKQLSYYDELVDRISRLFEAGKSDAQISERLNEQGYRTAEARPFTRAALTSLRYNLGLKRAQSSKPTDLLNLAEDEWTTDQLAERLQMPRASLYNWIRSQKVNAEKRAAQKRKIWVITADQAELQRLEALREQGTSR